jgi:hypothetical protein
VLCSVYGARVLSVVVMTSCVRRANEPPVVAQVGTRFTGGWGGGGSR